MDSTTARSVVRAQAVRDALDLLTEIATPLRVRMALGGGRLTLTTHGDEPWWATVMVALTNVGAEPAPPRVDESGSPIGTWEVAGGRYEHPDGRVLVVPASSLSRFVAREIETVELLEDGAVPYLVGRERGRGAAEMVLVVGGEWV